MNPPKYVLRKGTRVHTHVTLEEPDFLTVHTNHLQARRSNTVGLIMGVVGGFGVDVYWVDHGGESLAVYCFTEFELASEEEVRLPTRTRYDRNPLE
jgi:hypothetical protein